MKKQRNNHEDFLKYAEQLKTVNGVKARLIKDKDEERWIFTSTHPKSLKVELTYHLEGMISGEVSLDIQGTDNGLWHTEETDLDFHIKLAGAAIKGEVTYNTSPVFRFKEICFKVGDNWQCTRLGSHNFGYIKKRRRLNPTKVRNK